MSVTSRTSKPSVMPLKLHIFVHIWGDVSSFGMSFVHFPFLVHLSLDGLDISFNPTLVFLSEGFFLLVKFVQGNGKLLLFA